MQNVMPNGRLHMVLCENHTQYLRQSTYKLVRWYLKWNEREDVIYRCGGFPNVPLMGTQGCINYNTTTALRQLGYPITHPPMEELVTLFVVHGLRLQNVAWGNVIKKGQELGPRSYGTSASYKNWLILQVEQIKLPFDNTLLSTEKAPILDTPKNEEVEELKETMGRPEEEKKDLERKLEEAYKGKISTLDEANKEKRIS
ncbi:hypothetical protein CR513_19351, partial [Mucuna pruriens]